MKYKIDNIFLDDVYVFSPDIFSDSRGSFSESWNKFDFNQLIKKDVEFVQDNESISKRGVLRGLHYQLKKPQGKLIRAIEGKVFDVAVDLRQSSRNFGKWCSIVLDSKKFNQIWIPPGYAHGFLVLSSVAKVHYKTDNYWHNESEKTIIWNDKDLDIDWPENNNIIVSDKDNNGELFRESIYFK